MPQPRPPASKSRQAQRAAAAAAIAREQVLRHVLDHLDPQPGDEHLDYPALLDRALEAVRVEQQRAQLGWDIGTKRVP